MNLYRHTVHYYETDKMGITHHSNYIRWMEEARVDFLEQIGWGYDKLEKSGIMSPVIGVDCKYKTSTTFSDEILIDVKVEEFKGVKLKLKYIMVRESDGAVVCEGHSEHCFVSADGKLLRLQREQPELCEVMQSLAESNE